MNSIWLEGSTVELRQLKAFVAIADAPSMGAAAKALHVSQPALSATLKRLEGELGCELFYRVHGRLRLSEVGNVALPRARHLLANAALLEEDLRDMAHDARALRVTFTGAGPMWWCEPRFSITHNDVELRCRVDVDADVEDILRSGMADAVVAGPREGLAPDIANEPFLSDRILLSVREESDLAARSSVCVRDERPPVLLKHLAKGEMHRHTLPFWESLEPQTKVVSTSEYFAFVQLMRESDAPAISTRAAAQYRPDEGRVLVPTTDPELAFDFYLYFLEGSRAKVLPLIEWARWQSRTGIHC